MGSAAQIGIGVLILGAAFVFGHYVHQNSLKDSADEQTVEDQIEWQSQQQIAELRRRINSTESNSTAPETTEVVSTNNSNIPKSSMPIAGLNRQPVVRRNDSPDLDNNIESFPGAPSVPAELPPIVNESNSAPFDNNIEEPEIQSDESIIQPDFSALAADVKQKKETIEPQTEKPAKPNQQQANNNAVPKSNLSEMGKADTPRYSVALPTRDQMTQPEQVPKSFPNMQSKLANVTQPNLKPIQTPKDVSVQAQKYLTYTTRANDSLQEISNRYFGKPDYYLDIYIANRNLLDSPIKVPANIKLRIPVYE